MLQKVVPVDYMKRQCISGLSANHLIVIHLIHFYNWGFVIPFGWVKEEYKI